MLSADMFGAPEPAAGPPPTAAAAAGAGDFGGFGEAAPQQPAAVGGGDFGGFGAAPTQPAAASDDFGGFGAPTQPAAAAGGDDFGGFGSFGDATPAAPPPSSSALPAGAFGAADDDSFGQFEAINPPSVPSVPAVSMPSFAMPAVSMPAVPAVPVGPAPAEGDLPAVLTWLLEQERFGEALACEQHMGAATQLASVTAEYEQAKEEDDLEKAIHLKKVVLPKLKAAQQPDEVVKTWHAPSPTNQTLAQMAAAAEAAMGAAEAAPFVAKCCRADLRALASSSLSEAALLHSVASASLSLMLELPVGRQAEHLKQLDELLKAVLAQVAGASKSIAAKPAGVSAEDHAAALRAPKVATLLSALLELRKLGTRLAASLEWHAAVFAATASAPLGAVRRYEEVRRELEEGVKAAHAAAGAEAEEEEEAVSEPLREGGVKYWACTVPMGKRCSLSLLPLKSEDFPELPPTVEWGGKRLHAPSANLWAHCVRNEVPV